jgi:ATP-dependent Clp protease protease subunit
MKQNEFYQYATKHLGMNGLALENFMARESGYISPSILEERTLNVTQMDVFSRLMMDRIIFLGSEINDYVANVIQAQLLFLDTSDPGKDITIYINSPGGMVYAGLGIYDTMNYITSNVGTVCTGMAASMASVLLVAGEKGRRSALPHSRVMIHQPSGGMQGQSTDMEITVREIQKLRKELYSIIAEATGQPFERVEKDSDRDFWMTAQEAQDYGMVDLILTKRDVLL